MIPLFCNHFHYVYVCLPEDEIGKCIVLTVSSEIFVYFQYINLRIMYVWFKPDYRKKKTAFTLLYTLSNYTMIPWRKCKRIRNTRPSISLGRVYEMRVFFGFCFDNHAPNRNTLKISVFI